MPEIADILSQADPISLVCLVHFALFTESERTTGFTQVGESTVRMAYRGWEAWDFRLAGLTIMRAGYG